MSTATAWYLVKGRSVERDAAGGRNRGTLHPRHGLKAAKRGHDGAHAMPVSTAATHREARAPRHAIGGAVGGVKAQIKPKPSAPQSLGRSGPGRPPCSAQTRSRVPGYCGPWRPSAARRSSSPRRRTWRRREGRCRRRWATQRCGTGMAVMPGRAHRSAHHTTRGRSHCGRLHCAWAAALVLQPSKSSPSAERGYPVQSMSTAAPSGRAGASAKCTGWIELPPGIR